MINWGSNPLRTTQHILFTYDVKLVRSLQLDRLGTIIPMKMWRF